MYQAGPPVWLLFLLWQPPGEDPHRLTLQFAHVEECRMAGQAAMSTAGTDAAGQPIPASWRCEPARRT